MSFEDSIENGCHETLDSLSLAPPRATDSAAPSGSGIMFQSILENLPDIVMQMHAEGRLLYANPKSEVILGANPALLIGKSCHELGLPESMCLFWKKLMESTLAGQTTIERDFFVQTPTGSRHFEVRSTPESNGSREPRSIIATVREVSRQRLRAGEVAEAGQRLLYHMNNSPLAVIEFSTEGRCLSWNHRAEEFFGQPHLDGNNPLQDCLPLVYPEDLANFQEIHEQVRSGRQMSAFATARFIQRNGSVSHGEWYLSGLIDDDGACRSILCFLNDVTDHESNARELHQAKMELEETVLSRTTTLRRVHDDLQKETSTRKHLERELVKVSEREHRRLGHDLHDGICQELAGIHFSVQAIMKRLPKRSPAHGPLGSIVDAIRRAIQHTRLLARGLAPFELQNGDLHAALTELAADTASMFQIECVFASADGPMHLDGETISNLYRIAQESVQNAIKHGQATHIRIALDCKNADCLLTITDNGSGIDNKTCSKGEGNGMGLTIMKHRAALIGGQVAVVSHNGGGTVVNCIFKNEKKNPEQNHETPHPAGR